MGGCVVNGFCGEPSTAEDLVEAPAFPGVDSIGRVPVCMVIRGTSLPNGLLVFLFFFGSVHECRA
jgi:hypothetical protein